MGAGKTELAYHISFFVKNIKLNLRGIEEDLPNRELSTNCRGNGFKNYKGKSELPLSLYLSLETLQDTCKLQSFNLFPETMKCHLLS